MPTARARLPIACALLAILPACTLSAHSQTWTTAATALHEGDRDAAAKALGAAPRATSRHAALTTLLSALSAPDPTRLGKVAALARRQDDIGALARHQLPVLVATPAPAEAADADIRTLDQLIARHRLARWRSALHLRLAEVHRAYGRPEALHALVETWPTQDTTLLPRLVVESIRALRDGDAPDPLALRQLLHRLEGAAWPCPGDDCDDARRIWAAATMALIDTASAQGDRAEILATLETLVTRFPNAEAATWLAELLRREGRREDARLWAARMDKLPELPPLPPFGPHLFSRYEVLPDGEPRDCLDGRQPLTVVTWQDHAPPVVASFVGVNACFSGSHTPQVSLLVSCLEAAVARATPLPGSFTLAELEDPELMACLAPVVPITGEQIYLFGLPERVTAH